MKIERKELLAVLERVKPAIARNDLVEQFAHLWFTGKVVSAYDDSIGLGIEAPLAVDFAGGVRGAVLLGMLGASGASEAELTTEGDSIKLKLGRSRLELPCLPADQQLWVFSKIKGGKSFELTEKMIEAFKAVSVAAGANMSIKETLGVALESNGKTLSFYATDDRTVARARVSLPTGWPLAKGERIVIPHAFVEQLIKQIGAGGKVTVSKEVVVAENKELKLYSRLIQVDKVLQFDKVIDAAAGDYENDGFEIPKGFGRAIERASIALKQQGEFAQIDLGDETLGISLTEEAAYGNFNETMKAPDVHGSLSVVVDLKWVSRGLPLCQTMAITERAAALVGTGAVDFIYLISVRPVRARKS